MRLLAAALRPLGRLVVAERFTAPPRLAAIAIPPPPLETNRPVRTIVLHPQTGDVRSVLLNSAQPENLFLRFPAFSNPDPSSFVILLFQPPKTAPMRPWQKRLAALATASRPPITLRCNEEAVVPMLRGAVSLSWRDDSGCYAEGWLETAEGRLVSVSSGPTAARLKEAAGGRTRFSLFVPHFAGETLPLRAQTEAGEAVLSLPLPPAPSPPAEVSAKEMAGKDAAFARFVSEANQPGFEVMEIGSRLVGSISEPLRGRFSQARRYVGMDVHPSPNVDLVGDAHFLSHLFGPGSFDAVFSAAVLEHLAMPWIIAAEINRVLRPGGLTYHITPQAWPLHEQPNDFWRFSDEALKLLFGKLFGFEVLSAGMADRVRMYPLDKEKGDLGLPLGFGYASAWVLARKVRDIDPTATLALGELGKRYPA